MKLRKTPSITPCSNYFQPGDISAALWKMIYTISFFWKMFGLHINVSSLKEKKLNLMKSMPDRFIFYKGLLRYITIFLKMEAKKQYHFNHLT